MEFKMKKWLVTGVLLAAALQGWQQYNRNPAIQASAPTSGTANSAFSLTADQPGSDDTQIATAFRNHQSNVQVRAAGVVSRVLADDRDGSAHQRFIVRLSSGQTLLIAHNIDLAPRVAGLREGDTIEFHGEYEWNSQGGVVHWTHHDPDGRHVGGWLRHAGRSYQ
jgi:Protein of unknown function (DUF3465)